jgi:hypothetical protein
MVKIYNDIAKGNSKELIQRFDELFEGLCNDFVVTATKYLHLSERGISQKDYFRAYFFFDAVTKKMGVYFCSVRDEIVSYGGRVIGGDKTTNLDDIVVIRSELLVQFESTNPKVLEKCSSFADVKFYVSGNLPEPGIIDNKDSLKDFLHQTILVTLINSIDTKSPLSEVPDVETAKEALFGKEHRITPLYNYARALYFSIKNFGTDNIKEVFSGTQSNFSDLEVIKDVLSIGPSGEYYSVLMYTTENKKLIDRRGFVLNFLISYFVGLMLEAREILPQEKSDKSRKLLTDTKELIDSGTIPVIVTEKYLNLFEVTKVVSWYQQRRKQYPRWQLRQLREALSQR